MAEKVLSNIQFQIPWDYRKIYLKAFCPQNIDSLHGKSCAEAIPLLEEAILRLSSDESAESESGQQKATDILQRVLNAARKYPEKYFRLEI